MEVWSCRLSFICNNIFIIIDIIIEIQEFWYIRYLFLFAMTICISVSGVLTKMYIYLLQSVLLPRPPAGKDVQITGNFRTTMFKRDYQRRQNIIKSKQHKDLDDTPKLSVEMWVV